MLVAVSDIHLGDRVSNKTGFVDFIEGYLKPNASDISGLYLLGDIFDLWRRNASSVILDNIDILNRLSSLGFPVYYIIGNHDFIMTDIGAGAVNDNASLIRDGLTSNMTICSNQTATNGNRAFRFIHGHQIEYWYALPFYEVFCRAMCQVLSTDSAHSNVWNLIKKYSDNLNPIVVSRVAQLSESILNSIELKLAGPLDGMKMSKQESAVIELDLLSPFVEIGRLCLEGERNNRFEKVGIEVRKFGNRAAHQGFELQCIENLIQTESENEPEELVNQFLLTWANVHKWTYSQSKNDILPRKHTQLLLHLRRIAAMLTVDLQPDEMLIHGHGHQSHIDETTQDADTGCWLKDSGSFITIDKGTLTLSKWPFEEEN